MRTHALLYSFKHSIECLIVKLDMPISDPKQALLAQFVAVARALGNPHRLKLLEFVAQGELSVNALASRIGLSIATPHLAAPGRTVGRAPGRHSRALPPGG